VTRWTLERAKNGFSEVVRRALSHEPQLVVRGGREDESVVVLARSDYERLLVPKDLVTYLAESPLAKAVREGAFGDPETANPFARRRDTSRPVTLE